MPGGMGALECVDRMLASRRYRSSSEPATSKCRSKAKAVALLFDSTRVRRPSPAPNVPRSLVSGPNFKHYQTETGSYVVTVELSDGSRATRDSEIIRLPGATT
jgi:hypothetical protein